MTVDFSSRIGGIEKCFASTLLKPLVGLFAIATVAAFPCLLQLGKD
jgi:hypothetical protein